MKMEDTLMVRRLDRSTGVVAESTISGVLCTVTEAVSPDVSGFTGDGQIIVRIPGEAVPDILCGDEICRAGSSLWFTVVQCRDNRKNGSGLSHWKVVGRR